MMCEKFLNEDHDYEVFFEYYTTDYLDGHHDFKLIKMDDFFYSVDIEDDSYHEDCGYDSLKKAIENLFDYSGLCYLKEVILLDETIIDTINLMNNFEYQKVLQYIFNNPQNEYLCFSEYCPPRLYMHSKTLIDDEPFLKIIEVKTIDFNTVKEKVLIAEFDSIPPDFSTKGVYRIVENIKEQLKENLHESEAAYRDVSSYIEDTPDHNKEDIECKEMFLREVKYFTGKLNTLSKEEFPLSTEDEDISAFTTLRKKIKSFMIMLTRKFHLE